MPAPDERTTVRAAHALAAGSLDALRRSVAFRQLPVTAQAAILRDLGTIKRGFATAAAAPVPAAGRLSEAMVGWRPPLGGPATTPPPESPPPNTAVEAPARKAATETLAARAGALSDEIDFPAFVAGLVHGTFDAMVDAAIRQMETYADLVSTVARGIDDFTRDNVSRGQAIDSLAQRYPHDLNRELPLESGGEARLVVRGQSDEEAPSPEWLADYGLEGEALTDDVVEQQLIPAARRQIGESRLKSLATMVLLGMNRIVVRDGSISAKVRFRAAARDRSKAAYASGQDAGGSPWGERGSTAYAPPSTMVSTVGVNVQAESDLKVELFGEVKINFASETMPLERFADAAQIAILERHSGRSSARPRAGDHPETAPAGSDTSVTAPTIDGTGGAA